MLAETVVTAVALALPACTVVESVLGVVVGCTLPVEANVPEPMLVSESAADAFACDAPLSAPTPLPVLPPPHEANAIAARHAHAMTRKEGPLLEFFHIGYFFPIRQSVLPLRRKEMSALRALPQRNSFPWKKITSLAD